MSSAFMARRSCIVRNKGAPGRSAMRRCWRAKRGCRWRGISEARMWRQAGRARRWCRCFMQRSRTRWKSRWPFSISAAWPMSPGSVSTVLRRGTPGPAMRCWMISANAISASRWIGTGACVHRGRPTSRLCRSSWPSVFCAARAQSLDRQDFADALALVDALSVADGAATLAAFTARAIAASPWPVMPRQMFVAGGGRLNPAIIAALRKLLPCVVTSVETLGWNGDALEAQCFAFLAMRVVRGLPLSFPRTTV